MISRIRMLKICQEKCEHMKNVERTGLLVEIAERWLAWVTQLCDSKWRLKLGLYVDDCQRHLNSLFLHYFLVASLFCTSHASSVQKKYFFFWHLPENKAKCVELFLSTLIYLPMKSSKYKSEAFPRIEERAKQGELGSAFYLLSSPPPARDLWSSVFRYDIPEKEIKWLSKNLASSLGPVTIW